MAFKFGLTRFATSQDQCDIPENGLFSLGAVRSVGNAITHFVMYCNGTGQVTFLQSTLPFLSYGNFDYVTTNNDSKYVTQFSDIMKKEMHIKNDYDSLTFLTDRECLTNEIF